MVAAASSIALYPSRASSTPAVKPAGVTGVMVAIGVDPTDISMLVSEELPGVAASVSRTRERASREWRRDEPCTWWLGGWGDSESSIANDRRSGELNLEDSVEATVEVTVEGTVEPRVEATECTNPCTDPPPPLPPPLSWS